MDLKTFAKQEARRELIRALHGTERDRIEYACRRAALKEVKDCCLYGVSVISQEARDKASLRALHQAIRLRGIAIRMGVWKP